MTEGRFVSEEEFLDETGIEFLKNKKREPKPEYTNLKNLERWEMMNIIDKIKEHTGVENELSFELTSSQREVMDRWNATIDAEEKEYMDRFYRNHKG
ncbi:hypothetical protein CL620_06240 [archaeon]|jgi:ribulose 1,5-bisphosphate carboxylase large subunit-like protein|nr:hypothetical protein [archaeon]|tara:strand:- start:1127 stop:1417 length:291 start_codon:yes stop_codon:yes gene_type:complete